MAPNDARENVDCAASGGNGRSTFRIEGEMTIYRALELKQALLTQLEQGAALDVDLAKVNEFDTAGVQLLILARNVARDRGQAFRVAAQSAAVADVLALLNLADEFRDSGDVS